MAVLPTYQGKASDDAARDSLRPRDQSPSPFTGEGLGRGWHYSKPRLPQRKGAKPDTYIEANTTSIPRHPTEPKPHASSPKAGSFPQNLAESGLSKRFAAEAHKVIAHFTKMSRI